MKIRKNHLLTMAIMSLLGVSQASVAAISSTMTLNGITREVQFDSQAQLESFSNGTASLDEQLAFAKLFTDNSVTPPSVPNSSAGLVSSSNVNGVPVSLINAGSGKYVIAQPVVDPVTGNTTTQYTTISKVASGGTTTVTASALAAEYIKSITDPNYVVNPNSPASAALATNVKAGIDNATEALVTPLVNKVGTSVIAPVALPPTGTALTATNATVVTDPAQIAAANVAIQLAKTTLAQAEAAAAADPTATLAALPAQTITAGAVDTLTKSPAVQFDIAQEKLAAAQAVTTATLASPTATSAEKAAAAAAQLTAANAVVTAAAVPNSGATTAETTAATQAVTDATTLVQNNPAFGAAAIAAQAAVADAQTAATAASAAVADATATQAVKDAKAVLADPNATADAKKAALAVVLPLVQAEVAAQQTLVAKQQAFIAALKADPNGASQVAAEEAKLATMQTALTSAKDYLAMIVPVDAALIASKASEQTAKVVAAVGTAAADVLAAEAALNAAASANDIAGANAAAQNLADQLAKVKTNQFQAKNNSTSGVAGNPASAMNMAVDSQFREVADFGGTTAASASNVSGASADIGGINTSVGVGLQYGYYDIGGKSVNTITMPLSVTAKFNPKHQLTISVPLSYIATQNQSDAYQVGVGATYKYNVTDNWTLSPAISYTYRSFDNSQNEYWNPNSSTSVIGGSISSKYTWNFNPMTVSLINMIGHFQSLDSNKNATSNVNFGATSGIQGVGQPVGVFVGTAANSTIANYVVKNGLHATKMFGNMKVGAYFADTEYFGSDLYFNQYDEFGFTLKPVNAGAMLDALSIDANYLFSIGGKHSSELDGFRLNLGYKF
jgi:hypothetical protein